MEHEFNPYTPPTNSGVNNNFQAKKVKPNLFELAAFACAIVTIVLFSAELYVLGTLGIIVSVACLIAGCRRLWRDVKIKREDEVGKHEQDNKKEYQTPWGQERQSPWKSKDKTF